MAEITLKFDARNQIAKKTIDYILSIGVFTENDKNGLSKPAIEKKLTKEEKFYNDFENSLKECTEIIAGRKKGILLKTTLNEL